MDRHFGTSHIGSLQSTRILSQCNACYEDYHANNQGYKCNMCEFCFYEECINVYISYRHKHRLKLNNKAISVLCRLCESYLDELYYECLQCSFHICIPCARKPLTFTQIKVHEHELRQIPIEMSFTCDACGVCEPHFPCVCLQCCFTIHRKCIYLPRVISINCHDHRISHVFSLGPEKLICGVCYRNVDGAYGAYSCLVCSYVVHSKCATNKNIWDGKELEGVPEEEEIKPFEVIDQNLIKHFSHEHNLKALLLSSRLEEPSERCYACTLPFYSDLCYKCTQCSFILHDSCANHPLKKKHVDDTEKLILVTPSLNDFGDMFRCFCCYRYCNGFSYLSKHSTHWKIDVRCASMSGRLIEHKSHPHSLFARRTYRRCEGCKSYYYTVLYCTNRDNCVRYCLCFKCATLPTMLIRPKYDDHPLFLCYNENNLNIIYCCGVCEEHTSSKKWFYKCNECGSTFHTECVFQSLIHLLPGFNPVTLSMGSFNLLHNNRISRPICFKCKIRCMDD